MKSRFERQTEEVLVGPHQRAQRVTHEHVLDTYNRRGQINDRQLAAGMFFRFHYERGMVERVTSPADGAQITSKRGSAERSYTEQQLDSRAVVNDMISRQPSANNKRLLIGVCGHGQWGGELLRNLPEPRGVVRALQDTLDVVANVIGEP